MIDTDLSLVELQDWIQQYSTQEWNWFVKVLAANDTLLNESHQYGTYVPRSVAFTLFPSLDCSDERVPRCWFRSYIDSHGTTAKTSMIWYESKKEARITNWGGKHAPVLNAESTGAICVFAFRYTVGADPESCHVWLCRNAEEEEFLTSMIGPVEPGRPLVMQPAGQFGLPLVIEKHRADCHMEEDEIPPDWLLAFPSGAQVVRHAATASRSKSLPVDDRLLRRRDCEYEIFKSVEKAWVLPRVNEGFATVDLFVHFAHAVTNRRKSRSGISLQLHVKQILEEEGISHSYDTPSEGKKRPDFLFPSAEAYHRGVDPKRLRMLAVKTTCKDRWRQILNEAARLPQKHLLTLQEGLSVPQFEEMQEAGVVLVVPEAVRRKYLKSIRSKILSLREFLDEVANLPRI